MGERIACRQAPTGGITRAQRADRFLCRSVAGGAILGVGDRAASDAPAGCSLLQR